MAPPWYAARHPRRYGWVAAGRRTWCAIDVDGRQDRRLGGNTPLWKTGGDTGTLVQRDSDFGGTRAPLWRPRPCRTNGRAGEARTTELPRPVLGPGARLSARQ